MLFIRKNVTSHLLNVNLSTTPDLSDSIANAKDINLHQKELSIIFRRDIQNMLIIGLSSQIAVRAETVNVTAHRVGWNT